MDVTNKIYRRALIEYAYKCNGWDNQEISKILNLCLRFPDKLNATVRTLRCSYSIARSIEHYRQGKLRHQYNYLKRLN